MENTVILREVAEADLPDVREYRSEFLLSGDSLDGTSCLRDYEDMAEWLDFIRRSAKRETCRADWVPDTQYLIVRASDGRLVGMIDIRDELNEECLRYYGHIGYSIQKEYRGKGYGTKGLALTLDLARQIVPEDEIYLRVQKNNIPSFRAIRKNGAYVAAEDDTHYRMRVKK